LLNSSSDFYN